jgi:two-component system nitrate/nitrite response regulator NarL
LFTTHEVATRSALERRIASLQPAVLLLDLDLPGLGRIRGFRAIHRLNPSTRVVLFASALDDQEAVTALKAGASGYSTKLVAPALLSKAVELVQKGEIWIARRLVVRLVEELAAFSALRHRAAAALDERRLMRLTPRERQIVELVGAGSSNKGIASQLRVTEATVKAHLTSIFRKMALSGRLQLALFVAAQAGPPGHRRALARTARGSTPRDEEEA